MKTITILTLTVGAFVTPALAGGGFSGIDVAIRDASSGDRVYVRTSEGSFIEHNFYTPESGYTGWSEVPNPGANDIPDIESIEAFGFRDGSLLYVGTSEDGDIAQNIYTPQDGWTGWNDLPHPDDDDDEKCRDATTLGDDPETSSVDVEIMGSSITSPRVFVRTTEGGLYEQCIYTPSDGFTPWSEIPSSRTLTEIAEDIDSDVESIQVTTMGGLADPRIFVAAFNEPNRIYQNIYTPGEGYTGWERIPNQTQAFGGGDNDVQSIDVQYLGGGVTLYLRGRENGRVQQNFYTPKDGFLGWKRVTRTDNPNDEELESCSVEFFDPGLNGARIYVRCFEGDEQCEQCFYDPATGTTRWEEIPD